MMRQYEEAILTVRKALEKSPRMFAAQVTMAMAFSALDRMEEARMAASEVLKMNLNFSLEHFAKAQPYKYEEDRDHMIDALRKVGLK